MKNEYTIKDWKRDPKPLLFNLIQQKDVYYVAQVGATP